MREWAKYPALSSCASTHSFSSTCSASVRLYTMMSSINTITPRCSLSFSTRRISRWKEPGAFFTPNGITVGWYSPAGVLTAISSRLFFSTGIWLKPFSRSSLLKYCMPASWSNTVCTSGSGSASAFVTSFRLR